jgi:hypothetical protein
MAGVTTDVDSYNRLVQAPREDVSYVLTGRHVHGDRIPMPKQAYDVLACLKEVFGTDPMSEPMIAFVLMVAAESGKISTMMRNPWLIFHNYRQRYLDLGIINTVRE